MVTRSTLESGISMLSADPTLRIENSLFKKLEISWFQRRLKGGRDAPLENLGDTPSMEN